MWLVCSAAKAGGNEQNLRPGAQARHVQCESHHRLRDLLPPPAADGLVWRRGKPRARLEQQQQQWRVGSRDGARGSRGAQWGGGEGNATLFRALERASWGHRCHDRVPHSHRNPLPEQQGIPSTNERNHGTTRQGAFVNTFVSQSTG